MIMPWISGLMSLTSSAKKSAPFLRFVTDRFIQRLKSGNRTGEKDFLYYLVSSSTAPHVLKHMTLSFLTRTTKVLKDHHKFRSWRWVATLRRSWRASASSVRDPAHADDYEIRAGSDTTRTTLSIIFMYLLRFPELCQRLRTELDTAVADQEVGPHPR